MRLLIIPIVIIALSSCQKDNRCFDGPGKVKSLTLAFNDSINVIQLNDDINYKLINDSLDYMEIQGGEHMIHNISISEENKTMSISNNNKCLFMSNNDATNITIHYSEISALYLNGYGTVESLDTIYYNLNLFGEDCYSTIDLLIHNDSTYISLSGSPQLTTKGFSNYLYSYTVGKGNFFLNETKTHFCHGHNRGIGDFHLNADQNYIIELRSRGDIYIYDTVGVQQSITIKGDGKIYYE